MSNPGTNTSPLLAAEKPTKVRWRVFYCLLALVTINYIDRTILSVALPTITKELNFSPAITGVILSAFFWGYAPSQIPSGWLADRIRPDKVVVGACYAWGFAEMLSGFVSSAKAFIALRVLLGLTEAPVYPGGAKLNSMWLTKNERGRGAVLIDGGAPLGTALGGPIIVAFMTWFGGWRGAMIAAGLLTMLAGWIVWKIIKGTPETHSAINEAEREYIRQAHAEEDQAGKKPITWKNYLASRNFICMCLGWFGFNIVWYGLVTWAPTYLAAVHNLKLAYVGAAVFIIFGAGFIGELVGGYIADAWKERGGNHNVVMRTVFGLSGLLTTASVFAITQASSYETAVALLASTLFFLRWAGLYWSVPATIAKPEHVGIVGGCMNLSGNCAGIVAPMMVGFMLTSTGSFNMAMMAFAAAGLLYTTVSLLINFNKRIDY